ncbi:hypothetical protein [Flavisphingomonas formosensis]|uniref:hypothetical protein n=1 Tax=Flavisphingomonas formosensis TaxID=861534 RepID=UPI0012FB96E1|nr:hypothetical protein [Sphingomonas formosensis]
MDYHLIFRLLPLLLVALLAMRFVQARRARRLDASRPGMAMPDGEGLIVPVTAAYMRGGFMFGSVQRNSIRSFLSIYREGIRFRVLSESRWLFSDMDHVDVREGFSGMKLIFSAKGRRGVFIADVPSRQIAISVLANLPSTLALTERAAMLRDGTTDAATPGLSPYDGPMR